MNSNGGQETNCRNPVSLPVALPRTSNLCQDGWQASLLMSSLVDPNVGNCFGCVCFVDRRLRHEVAGPNPIGSKRLSRGEGLSVQALLECLICLMR